MAKKIVDILNIDDTLEAVAIRSVLEWWGVRVNLYSIATSQHLIDLLNGKEIRAPHIALLCHGVKEGIVLPELDEGIVKKQPYIKVLTPNNFYDFLSLENQVIMNTGCHTGTKQFADVFLHKGASAYIAPRGYPEGSASLYFVISFYYYLFVEKKKLQETYSKALSISREFKTFELFEKKMKTTRRRLKEAERYNLRERLKKGAIRRAERDLSLIEEK